MDTAKIIFAGAAGTAQTLGRNLEPSNAVVSGAFVSGRELLAKAPLLSPDLLITEYELPDTDGVTLAGEMSKIFPVPVILLTEPDAPAEKLDCCDSLHVFCLAKPVNAAALNHTISLALRMNKKIRALEEELQLLKNKIADRKIIEKAKGLLMKDLKINEDESYRFIQKKAMDDKRTMAQIAGDIIETRKRRPIV